MNVGGLVGGIALGVGAGVGAGVVMNKWSFNRQNVSPEVKRDRQHPDPAVQGYAEVIPWIGSLVAGGAAAAGGVSMLQAGRSGGAVALGVGLLGVAGMFAGGLVGAGIGAARGSSAAHETYDPSIADDVDKLLAKYDRDKDGEISLEYGPDELPEYLKHTGVEPNHYIGVSGTDSIQSIVQAADTDKSGSASRQELVDLYSKYDKSGNGKLNGNEHMAMVSDRLYERH